MVVCAVHMWGYTGGACSTPVSRVVAALLPAIYHYDIQGLGFLSYDDKHRPEALHNPDPQHSVKDAIP
jgi:hypothetical protein